MPSLLESPWHRLRLLKPNSALAGWSWREVSVISFLLGKIFAHMQGSKEMQESLMLLGGYGCFTTIREEVSQYHAWGHFDV